jgi:hypothetical protein
MELLVAIPSLNMQVVKDRIAMLEWIIKNDEAEDADEGELMRLKRLLEAT